MQARSRRRVPEHPLPPVVVHLAECLTNAHETGDHHRVRDERTAARFAIALELRTIAAYSTAVHQVGDSNVVRTIAGAMGTDGQQLVVLRQLIGAEPVPTAFETGSGR